MHKRLHAVAELDLLHREGHKNFHIKVVGAETKFLKLYDDF